MSWYKSITATCRTSILENLRILEEQVTCAICLDHYLNPRTLQCHHFFCQACLQDMPRLSSDDSEAISCPKCHVATVLPHGKVDKLRAAFFVYRLKMLYVGYKRALIEKSVPSRTKFVLDTVATSCGIFEGKKKVNAFGRKLISLFDKAEIVEFVPSSIFLHSSRLGWSALRLCSVAKPQCMVFSSTGEIVVGEKNGDVVALVGESCISLGEDSFGSIQAMAIDSDDVIYVIEDNSTRMSRFLNIPQVLHWCRNPSKPRPQVCIETMRRDLRDGPEGYMDIALVGDRVYLIEQLNSGQVLGYDKTFDSYMKITFTNAPRMVYLCSTSCGNLMVADICASIHVLKFGTRYIQRIILDIPRSLRRVGPICCCPSGRFLYIGDPANKDILVFYTDGSYFTRFGLYGRLCVDQVGFVYVCARDSNCVYCF